MAGVYLPIDAAAIKPLRLAPEGVKISCQSSYLGGMKKRRPYPTDASGEESGTSPYFQEPFAPVQDRSMP
ncbi:hypothetical protein PT2222_420034 [Paraburkholderia tropica]